MFTPKRKRIVAKVGIESRTKQSFKDECDINKILRQYQRTGVITHIKRSGARFEDLPDANDYQEAMNMVIEAEAGFASLPAKLRARFANDPREFLAALDDPANQAEFEELGILKPRRPDPDGEAPSPTQPTGPAAGPAA